MVTKKHVLFSLLAVGLSTAVANASDDVDMTGFYVGGAFERTSSGKVTHDNDGSVATFDSDIVGSGSSLIVGYNTAFNNVILGAELSYTKTDADITENSTVESVDIT